MIRISLCPCNPPPLHVTQRVDFNGTEVNSAAVNETRTCVCEFTGRCVVDQLKNNKKNNTVIETCKS